MRVRWTGSAVFLVAGSALVILMSAPAVAEAAAQTTPTTVLGEETRRWTCEFGVPAEFHSACVEPEEAFPRRESGWSWYRVLAVAVWFVLPLALAVAVAEARGQSIVIAVILTLILGWIGFVIVYAFLGRRARDRVAFRSSP